MMMHKKLQKVLAIALMTSFFSTSFIMGVSEAAPVRHGGGWGHAQEQRVRPAVYRQSPSRQGYGTYKTGPSRQGYGTYKSSSNRQGYGMRRDNSSHRANPMMHKGGRGYDGRGYGGPGYGDPYYGNPGYGGPVIQQRYPAPPPPPYRRDDDRHGLRSGEWLGALIIGGIIGAVIANNNRHTHNAPKLENVEIN